MTEGVLDTSVLIAAEAGRPMDEGAIPDDVFVSVVTVAELEAGVLAAPDTTIRAARLRTLQQASALVPLPIDGAAAATWARLFVSVREARRRLGVNDLWIAAVAVSRGLPVVTQDGDFDVLAELGLLDLVRV